MTAIKRTYKRTLFLTGAPTSSSLQWGEEDLCSILQPCCPVSGKLATFCRPTPDDVNPSWRTLSLVQAHLPTGLTQACKEDNPYTFNDDDAAGEALFLGKALSVIASTDLDVNRSESSLCSVSDSEEILSQYYEHSFAVHDGVPSSQIVSAGSMAETSILTESVEYSLELTTDSIINSQDQAVCSRLTSVHVNDLKDVPNANYLRSIVPQTMTISLVVGLISVSQPRTIKTRKGGHTVELVEMLVGDDTRSGFGINIWLPEMEDVDHPRKGTEDLRSSTRKFRPQDIVLVRNVALDSFRGKVYGQSLRKNVTTIDLLYRNLVDKEDIRGAFRAQDLEECAISDPQLLKVRKVKDWVMHFVGTTARPAITRVKLKDKLHVLPSDTP